MNLRRTLLLFSFIFAGSLAIAQPKDRWTIQMMEPFAGISMIIFHMTIIWK